MKRRVFRRKLPPTERCDPKCVGWLHMTSGYGDEIQRCDDCKRFKSDEDAVKAHRVECKPGCRWPEHAPRPWEKGYEESA